MNGVEGRIATILSRGCRRLLLPWLAAIVPVRHAASPPQSINAEWLLHPADWPESRWRTVGTACRVLKVIFQRMPKIFSEDHLNCPKVL
jgi:hypothetical protein